jgi:hypothetical protein
VAFVIFVVNKIKMAVPRYPQKDLTTQINKLLVRAKHIEVRGPESRRQSIRLSGLLRG